ncbi:MAG: hypothetical protein JO032_13580, partial [Alphaproteobacteria bacterium]|nr:hypothetical protein [Alphaproteobacteria bacterium]
VGVAESRQQAYDLYAESAEYFYGRCLHIDPRFSNPPGYTSENTMRAGVQGQVAQAANQGAASSNAGETRPPQYATKFATLARQMDDIIDRGYVIIGSPDEVVDQLTAVAEDLNVGHLMLLLQFGNMGKQLAKYNTRLFAETVMPRLKHIHSEWEDKWWPQPMGRTERAAPASFHPVVQAAAE